MRRLLSFGLAPLCCSAALAQPPTPAKPPQIIPIPETTRVLPAPGTTLKAAMPGEPNLLPPVKTEVVLPQKETLAKMDANALTARRDQEHWVVAQGFTTVRSFGSDQKAAEEFVKTIREMKPTEWGTVGTGKVVVEYGLSSGKAQRPAFSPKTAVGIDPATVRVEAVRGVWVLRDDENILLNFGPSKEDAEQAFAVIRKYEFNRIGQVGAVGGGATFLFAQDVVAAKMKGKPATGAYAEIARATQELQLSRTAIELPNGGGAVGGEKMAIDPKQVELKRDHFDWKLMHNGEELANFGSSEWSGRDALKLIQDQRFTEFCRFNPDVTFFLVNGQAPTKVPFAARATRFDRDELKVKAATDGKYGLYEGFGRQLFVCDTEKEAGQLLKLIQQYGFDTSCQVGLSSKSSLKFLAKSGR